MTHFKLETKNSITFLGFGLTVVPWNEELSTLYTAYTLYTYIYTLPMQNVSAL